MKQYFALEVAIVVVKALVTLLESSAFTRAADRLWTDKEKEEFSFFIGQNYTAGKIIEDTNGVRKIRWSREGSGKSAGVRVIYFYYDENHPILLLLLYAKNEKENLTREEKNKISDVVFRLKKSWKNKN